MKFDIPLLKKCAFAVTLLSLSHIQGFADEAAEDPSLSMTEKNISMHLEESELTADSFLNDAPMDDLMFDQDEDRFIAKNHRKRRKKNKKPCVNQSIPSEAAAQLAAAPDGNNTWVPRFVWIGDVENSDNLKCFAAFLIGSLSEHSQMNAPLEGQKFAPGFFTTPNNSDAEANLSSALDQDYIAQKPTPRQRARQKDHRQRARSSKNSPRARVYLDFHAGPSFLFFSGFEGNLMPKPAGVYPAQTGPGTQLTILKGKPKYNVTPLFEMDATFNVLKWLGISAYLQSNQGTYFTTDSYNFNSTATGTFAGGTVSGRFQSAVDFHAVGGKVLFSFPNLVKFKTWSMGLFGAGGAGVGYQTWKNSIGYQKQTAPVLSGTGDTNLIFNTTNLANLTYTADLALSFKARSPFPMTLFKVGCKFIGWGPTRDIGEPRSPQYTYGYIEPIKLEGIFSVVPYIGFTWSF